MRKHEEVILLVMFFFTVLGSCFLYYWYFMDAITVRPIITYTQEVNPSEFKLEKTEYKRGEMVKYYNSFCKNREAVATTQWSLVNEMIIFYSPTELMELPIGCYPQAQTSLSLQDLKEVPVRASLGKHKFVGVITRTLPDGRVRKQEVATQEFIVVE